jgi:AcrR family transcriptional regulator
MPDLTKAAGNEDPPSNARERILDTAYNLFARQGIRAVGVDTVVAEAGVAKMTLYRHFPSKNELVLAFLQQREERWTRAWLQGEIRRRASSPTERLLAIFDVFDEWFHRDDFEGCSFINVLLEIGDRTSPIHIAATRHLASIRALVRELAEQAGAHAPEKLARQWHILMKGSIVAAGEGDRDAARLAKEVGRSLLAAEGVRLDPMSPPYANR